MFDQVLLLLHKLCRTENKATEKLELGHWLGRIDEPIMSVYKAYLYSQQKKQKVTGCRGQASPVQACSRGSCAHTWQSC